MQTGRRELDGSLFWPDLRVLWKKCRKQRCWDPRGEGQQGPVSTPGARGISTGQRNVWAGKQKTSQKREGKKERQRSRGAGPKRA